MDLYRTKVVIDRLGFPEDPRWHAGSLWFSDMDDKAVMKVLPTGSLDKVTTVEGTPSGLGWAADGTLLVVSMSEQKLLEIHPARTSVRADLSRLASFHCNDMVIDDESRAYIGTFGFDFDGLAPFHPGQVLLVPPAGPPRIAADGLSFPNGLAMTPDKKTLVVAETLGERLTAFDILPDGNLVNQRTWAELPGTAPDGICLDDEGALWVASPISGAVFRVREGGEVLAKVQVASQPYACRLGGVDRLTLFVTTSYPLASLFRLKSLPTPSHHDVGGRLGRIESVTVEVPGAGYP